MTEAEPAAGWLLHLDGESGEVSLAGAAETFSRQGFVAVLAPTTMCDSALALATPEEEQAASRRRDPSGYLLRRRIARTIAALGSGRAAHHLKIGADSLGKPVFQIPETDLPFDLRLHLSFSARDDMSLVGVARQRIGVDLEGEIAVNAIPWNILRQDEAAAIKGLPLPERARAFVRLWCLKEAFLKASGAVLSVPPEAVRISSPLAIDIRDGAGMWRPAAAGLFQCDGAMADCGNHALPSRHTIAVALLSEAPQ